MWAAQVYQQLRRGGGAVGVPGLLAAVSAAVADGGVARRPRTLTTIWSTRDGSLINAFSHMLDPPQPEAGPADDPQPSRATPPPPAAATPGGGGSPAAASSSFRESTPRSNALTKGERLAKARKWASSFSIHAKRTFGRAEEDGGEAEGGDGEGDGEAGSAAASARGLRASPSAASWRSSGGSQAARGAASWRAAAAGATVVDLRVHLTSGRKKPAPAPPEAAAAAAGDAGALPAAAAPAPRVRSARMASTRGLTALPFVPEAAPLGDGAAPALHERSSPRPRSLNRWGSARAIFEAGAAALLHGPAPPEDATVQLQVASLASAAAAAASAAAAAPAAAAEGSEALPVVNRLRPDIPRLLEDVAEGLAGSGAVSRLLLHQQRSARASAAAAAPAGPLSSACCGTCLRDDSALGRLVALGAVLLRVVVWALCLGGACRRWRAGGSGATAVPAPVDLSSGVDDRGRTAVAVYVCGPQEMVLSTLEACRELNEGPTGRSCVFHVHAETFSF